MYELIALCLFVALCVWLYERYKASLAADVTDVANTVVTDVTNVANTVANTINTSK